MEITFEQIEEFYKYLQGEMPEGVKCEDPVKLTPENAYSVIWYLKAILPLIPDNFEHCTECGDLFDSDSEGIVCDVGNGCGACEDAFSRCDICKEHFKSTEKPDETFFTLSKEGAEEQDMKPGLYSVKCFPVYSSDYFSTFIDKHNVELIKELDTYEKSNFICGACFEKQKGLINA